MKRVLFPTLMAVVLMLTVLAGTALAVPAPDFAATPGFISATGGGSFLLADEVTEAAIEVDIRSVGQPKTMTYDPGNGSTVIYDLFRATGFISITVEDDDFAFTARPREVYATWEGVYGIALTYLYRGELYQIRITQNYSSGDNCRVYAATLPGYPDGTGTSQISGLLTPSDGIDITAPYNP